jgi:hypothetical protein
MLLSKQEIVRDDAGCADNTVNLRSSCSDKFLLQPPSPY